MTKRLKNKDKRELEKKLLANTSIKNESEYNKILEKLKKLISDKKVKNRDYISLYSITKLLKSSSKKLNVLKETCARSMEQLIYEECGQYINIVIGELDSSSKKLSIGIKTNPLIESEQYKNIVFSKENNELCINRTELDATSNAIILRTTGSIISNLYDELAKYSGYKDINSSNIKIPGSIFSCGINKDKVTVEGNINGMELQIISQTDTSQNNVSSNSSILINAIKGHEDELFKKAYIKINDCPKYLRKTLKEVRRKQLTVKKKAKVLVLKSNK